MRHDVIDQAGADQLRRRVELSREAHLARLGEADALDDVVRARELGHQAHAHEEHAHPGLVGSKDDVEREDHREADANRHTVDGGDERLRLAAERDPVATLGALFAAAHPAIATALDPSVECLLDVGAGAEPAPGSGHHHRADRRVSVGGVDGVDHLEPHLVGPGVELLGTIEGEEENVAAGFGRDLLVAHRELLSVKRNGPQG